MIHSSYFTKPRPGAKVDLLHPINRGLIGWWPFSEGAGSRIEDISGNRHHGELLNLDLASSWRGSLHGGSLFFDGTNDQARVLKTSTLSPLTSMSGSLWMNAPVQQNQILFSHANPIGDERAWFVRSDPGGDQIQVVLSTDGTFNVGSVKSYSTSFVTFDDTWHHLVWSFDVPPSVLDIYVDGRLDLAVNKGVDASITSLHDSPADVRFGTDEFQLANFFEGLLGNARLYNRALTSAEAQLLFNNPFPGLLD